MIRLGLRLATAGGRGALIALALTALSVAIGTAILLFALAFKPALDSRSEQAAWRTNFNGVTSDVAPSLLVVPVDDVYQGQPLVRFLVAQLEPGAPVPPGIERLPAPGEAFVSPALAALLTQAPADQLGDRLGMVVGTIGDQALRSPQELVAVIGSTKAELENLSALPISSFAVDPPIPPISPIAELMIILAIIGALAPVAVFVSTATRLSAARREQRLAALRLVGATGVQVTGIAVVEAVLASALGAAGGVALFFLVRPLIALIPLDGATWFPGAIQPPTNAAIAILLLIPVLASLVAAAS
ncbi:MAG TPA: FtsX-like permease family protein, partial [Candidatus Limnocylindrales bacterium]